MGWEGNKKNMLQPLVAGIHKLTVGDDHLGSADDRANHSRDAGGKEIQHRPRLLPPLVGEYLRRASQDNLDMNAAGRKTTAERGYNPYYGSS